MKNCPKCGCDLTEEKETGFEVTDDDEHMEAQKSAIAELLEMMQGDVGNRLKSKKPTAMSVEIVSGKPKMGMA